MTKKIKRFLRDKLDKAFESFLPWRKFHGQAFANPMNLERLLAPFIRTRSEFKFGQGFQGFEIQDPERSRDPIVLTRIESGCFKVA